VLSAAGELVVWQLAPHRELARWIVPGPMPLHAHHGSFPVAFNDAGDLVAVGGIDGRVRVWRVDPLQEVASFVPLPPGLVRVRSDGDSMNYSGIWTVEALAFAPGRPLLAVGGSDGLLKLWDVRSSVAVDSAWMMDSAGSPIGVGKLAFDPQNASLLVATWDGVIRRFNAGTWREQSRLTTGQEYPRVLALSGSSPLLAYSGNKDTVSVFDGGTGRELCRVRIEGAGSAAFAFGLNHLVVGDGRSGVTLIDPLGCRSVPLHPTLAGSVTGVWFTPDCRSVVAALNVSPRLFELRLPAGWARC
jgi:WD40 repeat protein